MLSEVKPQYSTDPQADAMLIYTSGTTGHPKGVIHAHKAVQAMIQSLDQAWQWSDKDRILNVLPMHHVHGIINVFNCSLWAGAECHMFD